MKYLENIKYLLIFIIFMIGVYFTLPSFTKTDWVERDKLQREYAEKFDKELKEKNKIKQIKNQPY